MDIARLSIVIDSALTRMQIAQLRTELLSLGTTTATAANQATQALNKVGAQATQAGNKVKQSANEMDRSMNSALNRIGALLVAAFGVRELVRFGAEAVKVNMEFNRMRNVVTGLTGSAEAAKEQLSFLAGESDRLGLNFRDTVQAFVRFEAAAKGGPLGEGQLRDIFVQTAEAARKFGLSTSEQERIFLAYEQMVSKGVVSMEELRRQLGDALPGAFQIGARAMGMTTRQFGQLVESGRLLSAEFLPKFAKQLSQDVNGAVDDLAVSLGRLQNAWDRFKNSIGETARPGVKSGASTLTYALDLATQSMDFGRFMADEVPNTGSYDNQRMETLRALRRRFPDASRTRLNPDLPDGQGFDAFQEFVRMQAEDRAAKNAGPLGAGSYSVPGFDLSGLPSPGTAEPLDTSLATKAQREYNKAVLEGLQGSAKIIESYRQEEEAIIALGLPLDREAQILALIRQNKDQALTDEDVKRQQDWAEQIERSNKAAEDLYLSTLPDGLREVEKINKQFREDEQLLLELEMAGKGVAVTYEDIVAKRDAALATVNEKGRPRIHGQDFKSNNFSTVIESWGDLEDRVGDGSAALAQSMDQNFSDAFTSMIMGTESVSDAFGKMATSIVADLVRIMVQQLLVRTVMGAFSAMGGAGGGDASVDHADYGTFNHVGGVAGGYGEGTSYRRRYHAGGVAGDEMEIVARRGEVYFTPEQMSALGKVISTNSDRGQQKIEIVNVMDPSLFPEQLYRNKNALINILGRESKTVRRTIGA